MGFFIRPKDSTRDDEKGLQHVEAVGVVQSYEDEYMEVTGHTPENVNSGAIHRRGGGRRPGPGNLPGVK